MSTTFNFNFRGGPVPAHHHPNGGGVVANTAHVDRTAFVGPDAQVFGEARVLDGALIGDRARVYGDARVFENAQVYGDARVCEHASVCQNARVYGWALVSDRAQIYGRTRVSGLARVFHSAQVLGEARVHGEANIYGEAQVFGDAMVRGDAWVRDKARVSRDPIVLTGFPHTVTITDHHICVGCEQHPPSVWRRRGEAIILADGHGIEKAREWAAIINALAASHGCVDLEEKAPCE